MSQKLRIFSGVWGKKHFELFEKALVASLMWPENQRAIKGATWTICTDEEFFDRAHKIKYSAKCITGDVVKLHDGQDKQQQFSLQLYKEMQKCIDENALFLFALPDWIYGDGTIANLMAMMTEPGLCLAVPNIRALPSILDDDRFGRGCKNPELVSLGFEYLHQTWREAELGKDKINSYYGGVTWKEIAPGLITVMHRLPSSFMCQFTQSDIEFFGKQLAFSAWDHVFPAKLIEDGRQRYVTSSDVGFIIEVTEHDKNCSPTLPVAPGGPSLYHRSLLHHKLNSNVVSVFRKG